MIRNIFAKKRVHQVVVKNDGQLRLATTFNVHLTLIILLWGNA